MINCIIKSFLFIRMFHNRRKQAPYIVYTSNIFAILELRALYFALASIIDRFYYIKYALAAVLIFIGSGILIAYALNLAWIPPVLLSLSIPINVLALGFLCSFIKEITMRTKMKNKKT